MAYILASVQKILPDLSHFQGPYSDVKIKMSLVVDRVEINNDQRFSSLILNQSHFNAAGNWPIGMLFYPLETYSASTNVASFPFIYLFIFFKLITFNNFHFLINFRISFLVRFCLHNSSIYYSFRGF